ncbi:MAG: DUF1015 domain-containing protein [Clostridia bacterium]|nr:DUF1015 domain-containing protein [Clostridia bacterium]
MKIFNSADILVPKNTDLNAWSVVACDQYTSEASYWNKVSEHVGGRPSALNIIFPEIYLNEENPEARIKNINETMKKYLDEGIFEKYPDSVILVRRRQRDGRTRYGVIGTVDLEQYDFSKGSSSRIRATEGTVLERIPPRVKIRENACLEMPHIIMLIDDRKKTVIEPLKEKKETFKKIYDFDLQMDSGHLTGYLPDREATLKMLEAAEALGDETAFREKYKTDSPVLQYAVGDGNHSLATAKTCWENIKKNLSPEEMENHPARFALVELMNVHDDALEFEPIHRVVFDVNPEEVTAALKEFYPQLSEEDNGGHKIVCCTRGKTKTFYINNSGSNLPAGTLTLFLDDYIARSGGRIDYIHGEEVVKSLCGQDGTIGFILPAMEKNQLFETVIKDGVLPRKTFSMGEAHDKRFYLECKNIQFLKNNFGKFYNSSI